MQSFPQFGDERTFRLERAILLYSERNSLRGHADTCIATIHNIVERAGKPTIEAGTPVTTDAIESLSQSLGRNLDACLLPDRILAVSLTRMIWWCPGGRRRIWFNAADADKKSAAKKLNGKLVAHPALVFVAQGRNLSVLALAADRRPELNTRLYVAPYWNLDPRGLMCAGNVKMPDAVSPSLITKFERAFFDSAYSHSHWGHRLTAHPGGHFGLWEELSAAKATQRFPVTYLVPTKTKLANLLKSNET